MKRVNANFTVEAAYIMPIVILLSAWLIHLAIGLYEKVEQSASDIHLVEDQDSLKDFREKKNLEKILDKLME